MLFADDVNPNPSPIKKIWFGFVLFAYETELKANETAIAYVNDATPGIYTLNRNFAAYEMESAGAGIDFTLYDESTVRRLIKEQPDLMPYYPEKKALKRGIDLEYGKKQITAHVTSGILTGGSMNRIAAALCKSITDMSVTSAIRAARTAVTAAENGGRTASYKLAADRGIELTREWIATKDARTRHSHGAADGQRVGVDEPFTVGGEKLMFPGDGSLGASGRNLYNCRCSVKAMVKGHERKRETYDQWLEKKQAELEKASSNSKQGTVQLSNYADVTEQWLKEATPNSHKILDLQEYAINNITYKVDGQNVKLEYSQHEKRIAELLECELGGELYMVPKVNIPQSVSTPDYLFRGKALDLKTITGNGKKIMYDRISKKKAQAKNFVFDLSSSPLSDDAIQSQIDYIYASKNTNFVDEIMIVKNDKLVKVVKRTKEKS